MAHITQPGSSSSKGQTSKPGTTSAPSSELRYGDPWAGPPEARDPVRRLRGRLVLPVTVWLAAETAPAKTSAKGGAAAGGSEIVGLTVSSMLVGQGEPAMLAGLISPTSDLADLLHEGSGSGFVVHFLSAHHKRLAQHFAGELPAPAEMLATSPSVHGPLLDLVPDRALCRAVSAKAFGWSLLVEAEVDEVQVGKTGQGLAWWRGEFQSLA
jgi:3-hydroxy-9,10-secoandrosta-1,3,5(10)-triene-9,17-dione monooxygenase reductase component